MFNAFDKIPARITIVGVELVVFNSSSYIENMQDMLFFAILDIFYCKYGQIKIILIHKKNYFTKRRL